VRGWQHASDALEYASSRFRDGDVTSFETIGRYVGSDLVTLHEVERSQAKVGGDTELSSFDSTVNCRKALRAVRSR